MTVARLQKAADRLVAARPGYDQGQRRSFYNPSTLELRAGGEVDCSMGCGWIATAVAGGMLDLRDPFWSGNFVERLCATGLWRKIRFTSLSQVKAGDFVAGPGHIVFARTAKRWWSAESDERGKASGGKAGLQSGERVGYRAAYLRSRGWSWIVRLVSPKTLLHKAITAYGVGDKATVTQQLRLLRLRAPWDGPRWAWFLSEWATWDKGVSLTYEPGRLLVPTADHAFVVLGSALTAKGAVTAKFRARLDLARRALEVNPSSVVLVTGGAAKAGVTEAEAGRAWLLSAGISPDRILLETRSASTVGNARNSVPILRILGVTSWTPISHASHLRRVLILFTAAQVLIETTENRVIDLKPVGALAVDDYSPAAVKSTLPVTVATRRAIAAEVDLVVTR